MKLWDFCQAPNRNEMVKWAKKERLGSRERGQLNQKLDMLQRLGFETAHSLDFLDGPLIHQKHIYKLVIHAGRMLRPMLCLGPHEKTAEMTLLCGAIEKDRVLIPARAADDAESNRQTIITHKNSGTEWRVPHERF